ncbi:TetR/AcrR family transcriptional regulator [Nocardia sp. 348MFTsu5.1]|uniref:TetR/AcrR family transcriptional regulator n=1 Tax=Nocardia sp. 348MFTsu5.1 TaxID=1172185 RepID=UPI000380F12E|nr:TetR/AcrR family transcriptional regulator [Nocardia sp. 348MFTsu5.1]
MSESVSERTGTDRTSTDRGDRSRQRLLEALDDLLRDGTLESINIAKISERAGVTRSAFYFYFASKADAVAALSAQMNDEAAGAARDVFEMTGPPRTRFETLIRGLVAAWSDHRYLYRAMLDARYSNTTVHEQFETGRKAFIKPLAVMIDAERAAGTAPDGPDSTALATVLLELNDRSIESISRSDDLDLEQRITTLVTIWLRAIYGTETE